METGEEMDGKGYVHYKSWHETYEGLVDPGYLEGITLDDISFSAPQRACPA